MTPGEGKCRSCGEPVLWVQMVKKGGELGKRNCLDVIPTLSGNIQRKRGQISSDWYGRVVPESERNKPLYTSHFVTCPDRATWRNR